MTQNHHCQQHHDSFQHLQDVSTCPDVLKEEGGQEEASEGLSDQARTGRTGHHGHVIMRMILIMIMIDDDDANYNLE